MNTKNKIEHFLHYELLNYYQVWHTQINAECKRRIAISLVLMV